MPAGADPALDLMPLKKALMPLDGSQPLRTHTTIYADGDRQGLSFSFHEDLQITARLPAHFRVHLTRFTAKGAPIKPLLVVSNGADVWTYQPSVHQYSMTSFPVFGAVNNHIPTLGLIVGNFYLGDGRSLVQGFRSLTPENSADVLAALGKMNIALSCHAQSVKGHDDYVYSLTLAKQRVTYRFYVDTQTENLRRVDLNITGADTQITFHEDIIDIASLSSIPKTTFAFAPPQGTIKAGTVSTNPF